MKATHKLKALGNVAATLAGSSSIAEAAQRLGVHRSTVYKWVRQGRFPAPGESPVSDTSPKLPIALEQISKAERSMWSSLGPLIAAEYAAETMLTGQGAYILWPSWQAWTAFYRTVRVELFSSRPYLRKESIAEGIFVAIEAGAADPAAVRDVLIDAIPDPRPMLRRS